jgi:hypothetical protein
MKRLKQSLSMIRHLALATMTLFVLYASTFAVATAQAATDPFKSSACQGLQQVGGTGCKDGGQALSTTINAIVDVLAVIVGVAAVIMIIISGFRYITSGGDAAKVGAAKSTLIYALIGLVIVALAKLIVHFVFTKVT